MVKILNRKILVSTYLCLFLFSACLDGQVYRFKNYTRDNNIPDGFIYTLNQDLKGYLWVGTGAGIAKFDGFDFFPVLFPDSARDRYPTVSLRDRNGKLWFGCNDGSVYYLEGDVLKNVGIPNAQELKAMLEGPDNFIYVIPQGKSIFKIDPSDPGSVTKFSTSEESILSACFTQSGNLLLGTQENIQVCKFAGDSVSVSHTIEGFDFFSVLAIQKIKDKDIYLAGTNGNGLFRLDLSSGRDLLTRISDHGELDNEFIQTIAEDREGNFWLSTNSGVADMKLSQDDESVESIRFFNQNSGLPGNNIRCLFQDIEGNYWIGLFGDGLSMLNSLAFSYYTPGTTPEENNIIYVNKIYNSYFLGTSTGFYLYTTEDAKARSFTDLRKNIGRNEIASYCVDGENNVWIGTNGGGLFVRNTAGTVRRFYFSGNSGEDYVNDVKVDKKYVWLGTLNGVIILDKATGSFVERYNIDNGLPHNSINQIFLTKEGKAAIATKTDRLYMVDPETGVIPGKAIMSGPTLNEIASFCQDKDGNLWASTTGNGIFEFSGDSLISFTKSELLMSDYGYSIFADSVNRIWIGHDRGISRFNRNTGIMRSFGTDFARGGRSNPAGMYESPDGKMFIGTTTGLIIYDRLKDTRLQMPAFNNINSVTINDVKYPFTTSITLPYNKRYNIAVDYVGINLRDPEKVSYQTWLENFDDTWSRPTNERRVVYTPRDGRYKFKMKSVNEDGLSSETPVSFDLVIKKPFWRTWWFILATAGVVSGMVILIVRQREKEQKKIQEYLEKELEARTSVVMKQKGEIELANLEITDSINYAKRIQTSILPDFQKVKETFADAFLIFSPRDIVSGDFYWFDKFDEERFMLVCADSTGHGVPGAFMSMIGSTLLQDIVTRQRISKPSEILKMLDNHIFSTLNQNVELGVSNDGMDMVVCEISVRTRHIRFASAMRPVILVLDGEPIYIKGNRSSVGGESVIEKFFDDQEYYLNPGDTLYLFSDGLPDQFGGTDGKKMKIARLKKLIEDVSELPLAGQKEVITKFYDEWKGDYDQVDDILMMGVRL
jgi:ligand-binding sensor domain-containing protein/serine phosphatase RsbU (regulator of sigma subunit)